MSNSASAMKAAEAALEKGDYNFCLKIIDPLLSIYKANTSTGAQLRLIQVTAYMGRGDEQKAIEICKGLMNNNEAKIRQQAKQLISILDAPYLPRPSNWSVEIPKIEIEPSLKSSFRKSKAKIKKTNHPPTGPTKNLDFGFSLIFFSIILLITFLLSGCVDISTNLSVTGPDRLNISIQINSLSGKSIPWQLEFTDNLIKESSVLKVHNEENKIQIESPTIRFEEVNKLLQEITSVASQTSGFKINKPELITNNKNWFIGTKQNLKIIFDLEDFPQIPGLKINVVMYENGNRNNFKAKPIEPTFQKGLIFFPLKVGQINQLEATYWKWNLTAIGLIITIFLTFLSILLQKIRVIMGFGFPELPP